MNTEERDAVAAEEQDIGALLQIRRDKLAALQNAGNDPFLQVKYTVTPQP